MDKADQIALIQDETRGSVAAELLAKHRRSSQPESQQICVVLGAILEVLDGEGMEATPTALFAAIMSSLQGARTSSGQSQQPPQASLWFISPTRLLTHNSEQVSNTGSEQCTLHLLEYASPASTSCNVPLQCVEGLGETLRKDWHFLAGVRSHDHNSCRNSEQGVRGRAAVQVCCIV